MPLAAGTACNRVAELRERALPDSPHERYADRLRSAGLETTALGSEWMRAAERALAGAQLVTLPAREVGYFAPGEAAAVGYRARVRQGQRLLVQVEASGGAPFLLFVDVFRATGDSARPLARVASADSGRGTLEAVAREDGEFLVRVQPELLRGGRYTVTLRAAASLAFPVEGRDSRAVQSFWGANRDGGRRRHEGIDIFAPRGTPVVAATAGSVAAVHTTAIGGNVVWLRDDAAPQSLYYAHLDRQLVSSGQRVRVGDTLGLVGNTGNARSTSPHLHFGVYRRGGPVDPFPFVDAPRGDPPRTTAALDALGEWRRVRLATTLRAAATDGATLAPLARYTPVRVLGAAGGSYRVGLPDGRLVGYVAAAQLEPLERAVARVAPRAPAPILDRPVATAAAMDSLRAGESRPSLGRFEGYAAVRTASGRLGWVPAAD
jgi:murein DD-endopeptidase MepM/ murein hydrolase activator NlpD